MALRGYLSKNRFGILFIMTAILMGIIIKIFFICFFEISSSSMEPTLVSGDYVLVNKMIAGPRIYRNIDFMKGKNFAVKRLKGFRKIQRNDILVFNYPYSTPNKLKADLNKFYVKRCVAIPGDTFHIENGIYKVKGHTDTLGLYQKQIQLSQIKENELRKEIFHCFPQDTIFNWNIKYFGPLYVPKKGDEISMNLKNILLYINLIDYETEKMIEFKNEKLYLNGKVLLSYTFRNDYYFMTGDRIFDSNDSRYWGLLPEDFIVGKVSLIWTSKDLQSGKFRWDRFFKNV
jgi:signal peptidase I